MRIVVRQSYRSIMIIAMIVILAFGTLFPASALYAAESDVPSSSIETVVPENPSEPTTPESPTEQPVPEGPIESDTPDIPVVPDQPEGPVESIESTDPVEANPLAPQNLIVVEDSITATGATIEWDHNPEFNDIHVWNADDNKYFSWGNSGSRTFEDLTPETKYRFYITWLKDGTSIENKSNIIEFTTLAGDPISEFPKDKGPRNLEVVEVTHNTVSLKWEPVPGFNHYWIWDQNDRYIFWANDGAQTVGGLTPETTYSFYVGPDGIQAPDLAPEQKSNLVTFTTLPDTSEYPDPPLTPPSYLRVTDVTEESITLTWGASPKATGYDLYVNGGWEGGTWDNSATSITYAPEGGMVAGQTYVFEVGAQNPPNPVSANSNKVTITWGKLEAPRDLQVVTATRTTVSLGWAPIPGATSYDIYQGNAVIGSSDSNRYVVTGLTEGQSYSYKVVAKNALWESAQSDEITVVPGSKYNIITYYISWAANEHGRNYTPSDIDVSQITHINYAFSDLCWKGFGTGATACQNDDIPLQKDYVFDGEMVIGDPEVDLDNFSEFATIKANNPHLKLLVSVGGWSWSKNFSNMAASEETRRAFANSVVDFLRAYQFEGIDIDWEYPVEGGELTNSRSPEDRENYTLLMKAVREALDAAGSEDGKYYLQTIASAEGDNFVVNADLANSSSYLDFINIMTYDYSGSWEELAHHNAPLYYDKNLPKLLAPRNNVQGGVLGHLNGGVPKYKLVVGVPFYGKGWRECPPNGQYQTCAGGTQFGTWESGMFDYYDLENNYIDKNGYVRYWNEASKAAYLYNSDKKVFITYNDRTSMMYTAAFLKSLDLAGVMSWDITSDLNKVLSKQLLQDLPINNTVNTSALAAPQNLRASSKSQTSIQVKWDASPGASGYEVFMNKQWVGYTTETQYTLNSLTANTNYKIHVLSIVKDNERIEQVSINSNELDVTTLSNSVTPPITPPDTSSESSPGSSSGGTPAPSNSTKDQLPAQTSRNGDKLIAKLQTTAAVIMINKSASSTFRIVVKDKARQIEVIVPKDVIAAIAKKGKQAQLIIVTNEVEYAVPIEAIPSSTDIRITIQPPTQNVLDQIVKTIQSKDMKLVLHPVEFRIEQLKSDQTFVELNNLGINFLSRKFTLNAKDIDVNRATGVIYNPATNEIRSVPTLFKTNADGTVTAELKRQGNSIYAIVSTNFSFQDAIPDWARNDVTMAAVKLIVEEESPHQFGTYSSMSRAEVISMIVKALGVIPDQSLVNFKDVDSQSKYAGDVAAAKQAGLIAGRTDGTFGPNDLVTRQDMAVMLANAMKYAGAKKESNDTLLDQFEDQTAISSYAREPLALMVEHKIMQGVSRDQLDPKSKISKVQATVMVMRMLRALGLSN